MRFVINFGLLGTVLPFSIYYFVRVYELRHFSFSLLLFVLLIVPKLFSFFFNGQKYPTFKKGFVYGLKGSLFSILIWEILMIIFLKTNFAFSMGIDNIYMFVFTSSIALFVFYTVINLIVEGIRFAVVKKGGRDSETID